VPASGLRGCGGRRRCERSPERGQRGRCRGVSRRADPFHRHRPHSRVVVRGAAGRGAAEPRRGARHRRRRAAPCRRPGGASGGL